MDDSFQHHSSSCSDSCGRMQQMLIFKLNVGVLKEIGIPYIPPTTFCLWTKLSKPSPGSYLTENSVRVVSILSYYTH